MTAHERFEQDLPQLLAQLVEGPRPDYRDSLVGAVARTPQRAAWTIPGRWLPMDITATRARPSPIPVRSLALAGLVGLLVLLAAALVVGSRQRLPAPFGPAGNGVIVYGSGGDLFALDPGATTPRPFLAEPAVDAGPLFSGQGDRLAFARQVDAKRALYVSDARGRAPRAITEPLVGLDAYAWSPDGRTIAVAHSLRGVPTVSVYRTDGSGGEALDLRIPATDPAWRPGVAGQLLVRALVDGDYDLYLVDVGTRAVTRLGIPHDRAGWQQYDGQRASWSPDGSRVVFEQGLSQLGVSGRQVIRLRVGDVAADGTLSSVRPLELDPRSDYEYLGRWLTTGDRLAFATQKGCTWQAWVAAGLDVAHAVPVGEPFEDCTNQGIEFELSPDGSQVVTVRVTADDAHPMWIGRADGTGIRRIAGTVTDLPTWQRVAP